MSNAKISAPANLPKSQPVAPRGAVQPADSRIIGLHKTEARRNSEWFADGYYLVRLEKMEEGKTRAPALRPFFVVNASVVANSEGKDGQPAGQLAPGRVGAHMVMLDRDGALRDVRSVLEAFLSPDEAAQLDPMEGETDEAAAARVGAFVAGCMGQALAGRYAAVKAETVAMQKRQGQFTKHTWYRATDEMVREAKGL
jgi:hypothetical protein